MSPRLIVFTILVAVSTARTASADLIEDQLARAHSECAQAVDRSWNTLTVFIDQQIEQAKTAHNQPLLDRLKQARAAAATQHAIPRDLQDAALRQAWRGHLRNLLAAEQKLNDAYEVAIQQYKQARRQIEAQALQSERDSRDPPEAQLASDRQFPMDRLGLRVRFPAYLQMADSAFADKDGLHFKEHSDFVRTRDGSFLRQDFTLDLLFSLDNDPKSSAFIGVGPAVAEGFTEPRNSLILRIHSPDLLDGAVQIVRNGTPEKIAPLSTPGIHLVRIEKRDNAMTFFICLNYDGQFHADITRTISDIQTYAPYLANGPSYLFFGGAGAFKQIRLIHSPSRSLAVNDSK